MAIFLRHMFCCILFLSMGFFRESGLTVSQLRAWVETTNTQVLPYSGKTLDVNSLSEIVDLTSEFRDVDPFDENRINLYLSKVSVLKNTGKGMSSYESLMQTVPLEKIKLLGTLFFSDDRKEALLSVLGKTFFVKEGDSLGANGGCVKSISKKDILIQYYVDDGAGQFIPSTIVLDLSKAVVD